MMCHSRNLRRGFTLVELLVVIAIIGVLMGLLLPAINAAREQGRITQCKSNLHNLALANAECVSKTNHYVTGGWGPNWVGYFDGGIGVKQPGGWVYNLLPYLDESNLHDLGQNIASQANPDPTLQTDIARQVSTTQSIMGCPTTRGVQTWPFNPASFTPYDPFQNGQVQVQTILPTLSLQPYISRGDYAANAGVRYAAPNASASGGLGQVAQDGAAQFGCFMTAGTDYPTTYKDNNGNVSTTGFTADTWSGVVYQRSLTTPGSVKDGESHTYLFGEKFIDRRYFETGQYIGDSGSMYSGMGPDNYRNTVVFPKTYTSANGIDSTDPGQPALAGTAAVPNAAMLNDQNDPGAPGSGLYLCLFGSPHSGVVNFAFCDGSVKSISVSIDPLTHRYLGERNDGKILDDAVIGQ
jgi:prepilin-type N-terminal cleavage/methylation domain-containing protein/prepilin-type processing-associated H-X9-DG protein